MKKAIFSTILVAIAVTAVAQEKKEYPQPEPMTPGNTEFYNLIPPVVTPGSYTASVEMPVQKGKNKYQNELVTTKAADAMLSAPSDAIVLFDGSNLDEWVNDKGEKAGWTLEDGVMTVANGSGSVHTKRKFGDVQIHLEWSAPEEITGNGQGRGNSGVFLQERYEVQVLDSYDNVTYSAGGAGSIYKQHAPLANPLRAPGEWNTYDIIYEAPTFKANGAFRTYPYVTVIINGVLVQNHVMILGTTEYIGLPHQKTHGDAPLLLQNHGNPVRFRNIWVREL